MHPEQIEAACLYGDRVPGRVATRLDVTGIRGVRAKLRKVSAQLEAGAQPQDVLHDLWKAMGWLDESLTPGMRALVQEQIPREVD